MGYNKIGELGGLNVPNLLELVLTENRIEKMENFGGHGKLKRLELRRNKIGNLQGLAGLSELT